MRTFLAGAVFGAAGSVHCIVMCGPLVFAAGLGVRGIRSRVVSFAAYHGGRGLMYQAIAVGAALVGGALTGAGLSGPLSVTCGLLMLAAAVPAPVAPSRLVAAWMRPILRASAGIAGVARVRPLLARFLGGVLNGLLPCGLTYAAALASASLGGVPAASVFMAGFCIGTLPALAVVSLPAAWLPTRSATRLRWVAPAVLAVAGVLLIVRGVEPMLSDRAVESGSGIHGRHHQGPGQ